MNNIDYLILLKKNKYIFIKCIKILNFSNTFIDRPFNFVMQINERGKEIFILLVWRDYRLKCINEINRTSAR